MLCLGICKSNSTFLQPILGFGMIRLPLQHFYRQAAADYGEAARLDPADAEARRLRGLAHHKQGDLEAAITSYSEAIRLDPTSAVAWGCRGLARYDQRDLSHAEADFEEAARLNPDYTELWNRRSTDIVH